MNFGVYDPNSDSDTLGQLAFSVACPSGRVFTVAMGPGLYFEARGDDGGIRRMAHGSSLLEYELIRIGEGGGPRWFWMSSRMPPPVTSDGDPVAFTVGGLIRAGQTGLPAGTYQDTVEVSVVVD